MCTNNLKETKLKKSKAEICREREYYVQLGNSWYQQLAIGNLGNTNIGGSWLTQLPI